MTDDLHLGELPDDSDPTAALLRGVLHRQADAVSPDPDGYARIRAGIERRPARRWVLGGGTGRSVRSATPLLAAAAALVVIGAAGTAVVRSSTHRSPAPAAGDVSLRTLDDNDARATPAATLPVYVAGRQGGRLVLFREFRRQVLRGNAATQVEAAVRLALTTTPRDPDYVRLFAAGQAPHVHAGVTDGLVTVDITPAPRPASTEPGPAEATAAVQQIVWTATAAAAVATAPSPSGRATTSPSGGATAGTGPAAPTGAAAARSVRITLGGHTGQALFGMLALDRPFDRTFGGDPRARAWLIEPAEGSERPPGPLTASGDAVAGDDLHVRVALRRRDGRLVHQEDVPLLPVPGAPGPLRPGQRGEWRVSGWDTSASGGYVIEVSAMDDDGRTWVDTKTFTVT